MKVYDIVNNNNQLPSLYETQKMIDHLESNGYFKHLDKILAESKLDEAAEMANIDGRWYVSYDSPSEMHEFGSRREARNAVNDFNRSGRKAPGLNASTLDRAELERRNQQLTDAERNRINQRKSNFKVGIVKGLRWVTRIANIAGAASIITQQIEAQESLYNNFLLGCYAPQTPGRCDGDPNDPEAQRIYTSYSKASYMLMVTQLSILVANAVRDARRARRIITSLRATAAAVGMVGGPVGSLLGFIIGQGISYGIIWLLSRPSTIETLVGWMFSLDAFIESVLPGQDRAASRTLASAGDWANPSVPLPASVRGDMDTAQDIVGANRVPGDIRAATTRDADAARNEPGNTVPGSGTSGGNFLLDLPTN